jgi:hypothetical protein
MYLGSGHAAVALGSRPGEEVPGPGASSPAPPEKADLVAAVWRLASRRRLRPARDHDEADHDEREQDGGGADYSTVKAVRIPS